MGQRDISTLWLIEMVLKNTPVHLYHNCRLLHLSLVLTCAFSGNMYYPLINKSECYRSANMLV